MTISWKAGAILAAVLLTLVAAPSARLKAADDQARIDSPADGAVLSGMVEITGRAVGSKPEEFDFYRLYVGTGDDPAHLRPIGRPFNKAVEGGVLATGDVGRAMPGQYIIVLRVFDKDGGHIETQVQVTVGVQPTATPFTVLTPLPTSDAFAGAGSAPRPTQVAVTVDELDASQPFQPFVLPDLPSRSVAPIQPIGPSNAPGIDTRPSDPMHDPNRQDDVPDLNP